MKGSCKTALAAGIGAVVSAVWELICTPRSDPGIEERGGKMMIKRVLVGVICLAAAATAWSLDTGRNSQPKTGPQIKDTLRSIIESAHDPDLRWPDFPLFRAEAMKFYEAAGYGLAWVEGRQPTPQALALIGALQDAAQKGLNAEDYDGPRWAERVTKLRQSPSDADLARFDLALTVSAGRYVAALHLFPCSYSMEQSPWTRATRSISFMISTAMISNWSGR